MARLLKAEGGGPLFIGGRGRTRLRRPAGEVTPPGPTVFDADFEYSPEAGTPGASLTALALNAGTTKSAALSGGWTISPGNGETTLVRTKYTDEFFPLANPVRINGVVRSNTGTRGWMIDMEGREPGDLASEGIVYQLDGAGLAAMEGQNFIFGGMCKLDLAPIPDGGENVGLDFMHGNAGVFNVLQVFRSQLDNAVNIHAHGQLTGGASSPLGTPIVGVDDVLIAVWNRVNVTGQLVEGFIIDGATKVLLGYTKGVANSVGLTDFRYWDYLNSYGGKLQYSKVVGAYGARAVVLQEFTIAAPVFLSVEQTDVGELEVEWTKTLGCICDLEFRAAGGAWTSLLTDSAATSYTHTGRTDGVSYEYRAKAKAAEYSSAWSEPSDAVEIDDSEFAVPTPTILDLRCNEGSGTAVAALVGPNFTTNGGWAASGSGQGLTFNPGSSQIASSNAAIAIGTDTITLVLWLSSPTYSGIIAELSSGVPNSSARGFMINGQFGNLNVFVGGNQFTSTIKSIPAPGDANQHMVAFFLDGRTNPAVVKAWVDGVVQTVSPVADDRAGSGNFGTHTLFLGARDGGNFGCNCTMDHVQIFNRELTAEEVVGLFNAGPQ